MRRSPALAPLLAVAITATLVLGAAPRRTDAQIGTPPATGQRFIGAWHLTSTTPFGTSQSLVTFMADGTAIFTDRAVSPGGAGFPVTFISTGHGTWKPTGPTTAAATWVEFVSDGQGNFIAVVTDSVEATLSAGGNTWRGPFSSSTTDPSGAKVLYVGGGTVEATRITVQPLATPAASPAATPAA